MRIGIDARMYGPNSRGLGRYVQKLVDNLATIDDTNEYYIFLSPANWDDFQTTNKNFIKVLAECHWYSLAEQIIFPIKLYKAKLDMVHFPHFNVPIFYRKKYVVTIHDLIVSHYPDSRATTLPNWFYKIKLFAYRLVLRNAIIKSREIITVSNYTKQDIERFYPKAANKIKVIYEGYDIDHPSTNQIELAKYKIDRPYLLYLGAAYPHKNLYRLLQAWKLCQVELKNSYQLVLAGRIDYFYQRIVDDATENLLDTNVVFTDYIADADLPALYQYSLAFVFPSYLEGFGLPAIEAQSYGTPVLAANNSSLPEILGKSALYFDPYDINNISDIMLKIIKDEKLRGKLIDIGYENSQRFNWQTMARQVIDIYNKP